MKDPRVLTIKLKPEDVMTQEDTDKIADVIGDMTVQLRHKTAVENDNILLLVAIEMLRKFLADFREFEAAVSGIAVMKDQEEFDKMVAEQTKKGPVQ